MQTLNLDELLTVNEEKYTFEDGPKPGVPQPIFSQDHFSGPVLAMSAGTVRGTELVDTFSVGGWDAGVFHRVEDGGPLVEGPHAFIFKNGTALTAHVQERREEILMEEGDTLIFRGVEYSVGRGRYREIALIPVQVPANA